MIELKPCPFCGNIPVMEITGDPDYELDYQVSCQYCFAKTHYEESEEKAAAEWNRRACDG